MPRAKHPQKREPPLGLKLPPLLPRDIVRRQTLRLKRLRAREGDRVGDGLAAEPVADEIRVTRPHDGLHARGHDGGELREEGAGVIPRGGEFVVHVTGTLLVGCFRADGFGDGGGLQVGGVGGGRVRVLGGFADVVDVVVVGGEAAVGAGLREGVLDAVGAGGVAILAVGVGAAGGALLESGAAFGVEGFGEVGGLGGADEGFVGVV